MVGSFLPGTIPPISLANDLVHSRHSPTQPPSTPSPQEQLHQAGDPVKLIRFLRKYSR
jgi:hypothetical protein